MPTYLKPAERFITHGDPNLLTLHRDQCADPGFKARVETALAEMVCSQQAALATDAAAAWYRVEGAKLFIHTFLNLAEKPVPKVAAETKQLIAT